MCVDNNVQCKAYVVVLTFILCMRSVAFSIGALAAAIGDFAVISITGS